MMKNLRFAVLLALCGAIASSAMADYGFPRNQTVRADLDGDGRQDLIRLRGYTPPAGQSRHPDSYFRLDVNGDHLFLPEFAGAHEFGVVDIDRSFGYNRDNDRRLERN